MFSFIILLIVSPIFISTCSASYCPNDKDLYPCKCKSSPKGPYIICDRDQQLNLTSIFSKVSEDVSAVNETYWGLFINNSKLIQIPENAFGKIKFNRIEISEGCPLLEQIHPNALSYQSKTTKGIYFEARNVTLEKSKPDFFYDLVNSFENLESLIYYSPVGTLEEKFGKNLNNLTYLSLRVDAIKGSPFSNMSKIKSLDLSHGDLNYVSKKALKIGNSNESLYIAFVNNKLNGSSFENDVFMETSLKKVVVSLIFKDNQINYLDEAVFMPFLTSKNGNKIDSIRDEPLDCDDCRSAWICKSEKSWQIRQAIDDEAKCVDGRQLIDCRKNFLKCYSNKN